MERYVTTTYRLHEILISAQAGYVTTTDPWLNLMRYVFK